MTRETEKVKNEEEKSHSIPCIAYKDKIFYCKGKLTVYKASEIKDSILSAFYSEKEKKGIFYFDLSAVELVDTSFFQILVAFKKTLEQQKCHLKILKTCKSFDLLLDAVIGLPVTKFEERM